ACVAPFSSALACNAYAKTRTPATTQPAHTGELRMDNDFTPQHIAQLFNQDRPILPFNPNRTIAELSRCGQWEEPAPPDAVSQSWYRAATTLHATKMKTAQQYQLMLILYEAADRRGHYRAMMHLTVLYTIGRRVQQDLQFLPERAKARRWLHEGLKRRWVGAVE